eukprot:g1574.t1
MVLGASTIDPTLYDVLLELGLDAAEAEELGELQGLQYLRLTANRLSGEIPKELGELGRLQELRLHGNQLSGEVPRELGRLKALEMMFLGKNQLHGPVPRDFGQLHELQTLEMSSNQLSGAIPNELGQLESLRELYLSGNQLTGEIPQVLGGLKLLRHVFLHSNHLEGSIPAELGRLHALEDMFLYQNQLSGELPKELGELRALKQLQLADNKLTGKIPEELGQMQSLEQLFLSGNELSGTIPESLQQLKFLKALEISRRQTKHRVHLTNKLSGLIPKDLCRLASLELLGLSENQLSGEIPPEIGQCKAVERIYLYDNQLSGEIPKELGELERLQDLYLARNRLRGVLPDILGGLASLQMLNLGGNQLSGEIPKQLGQLKHLVKLDLWNNNFTGCLPKELGQLHQLQVLHLSDNQLSGVIPEEFGKLKALKTLSMGNNQLEGPIPHLGDCFHLEDLFLGENALNGSALEVLSLDQNDFVGEVPRELAQLENLKQFSLAQNQLTGSSYRISSIWKSNTQLEILDLSWNAFSGDLGVGLSVNSLKHLRYLDLSHNNFHGGLAGLVERFCQLSPKGGDLQELRLNHNDFTGEVPACLMQFPKLKFLALNNNRLQGPLPEVNTSELVILALHKNQLSGVLPKGLKQLKHLGVLTLHQNFIGGSIIDLSLTTPCMDNAKFITGPLRCWQIKRITGLLSFLDLPIDRRAVEANCPTLWDGCKALNGSANVTLHRNRFSCQVPESLTSGVPVTAGPEASLAMLCERPRQTDPLKPVKPSRLTSQPYRTLQDSTAPLGSPEASASDVQSLLAKIRRDFDEVRCEADRKETELIQIRQDIRFWEAEAHPHEDHDHYHGFVRQQVREKMDQASEELDHALEMQKVYRHMAPRTGRQRATSRGRQERSEGRTEVARRGVELSPGTERRPTQVTGRLAPRRNRPG